ncbi:Endonuclease/exonuclease/phosphatase [Auriculariales sp. MPI-PUGE-AT-0066]|nr:Endonuclease/exonuclease/phosphatase [Auriculariales sp. MPI-PUGE-AT-0066]
MFRRLSKQFKELTARSPRLSTMRSGTGAISNRAASGAGTVPLPTGALGATTEEPPPGLRTSSFLCFNSTTNSWQPASTTIVPAEDASAITSTDQPALQATILTWNVWFSPHEQSARSQALLNSVLDSQLGVDIVCFQEVETKFWQAVLQNEVLRQDWLVSNWAQQQRSNWYGTTVMVRRGFLTRLSTSRGGAGAGPPIKLDCEILPYVGSKMGRQLLIARISVPKKGQTGGSQAGPQSATGASEWETILTVTSTHLESYLTDAPQRGEQIQAALSVFGDGSQQPRSTTVWCGDSNIASYDELAELLRSGFVDSLRVAQANKFSASYLVGENEAEALYRTLPTFGTTYPVPDEPIPKRIDYVLVRNADVLTSHRLGDEPVGEVHDSKGRDGRTFPSDHLGVCTVIQLPREWGIAPF